MTITAEVLGASFTKLQDLYIKEGIGCRVHVNMDKSPHVRASIKIINGRHSIFFEINETPVIPKGFEIAIKIEFGNLKTENFLKTDFNNLREISPFGIEPRQLIYTKTWLPIKSIEILTSQDDRGFSKKVKEAAKIANEIFATQNQSWVDYFKSCFDISI